MAKHKKDSKHPEKKKRKKKSKDKSKRLERDDESDAKDEVADPSPPVAPISAISSSSRVPITVSVNIASNLPSASTSATGWSWGAAFAAASTIKPNEDDLDVNFLKRAAESDAAGASKFMEKETKGIRDISQLAKQHKIPIDTSDGIRKPKRKFSGADNEEDMEESDETDETADEVPLEGRMVSLADGSDEMVMVLVDKESGAVYSSGERTSNGHRLVVGTLAKGKVQLDHTAVMQMKQLKEGDATSESGPSFPYPTNPDDHCETPLQSYQDILPILNELRKGTGATERETLKIYDPYFCNGSVVKHLASLGYTNVYNKKEDCYKVWKQRKEPPFDAFLTNPPYSDDHIDKLMEYLASPSFDNKPWLLLMPSWVHKKDYYINATTGNKKDRKKGKDSRSNPFYIVPKKRYVYVPPPDFREKKVSDVHKKSSPFTSMWYIWGGTNEKNEALIKAFQKSNVDGCDVARSRSALRDLRRGGGKDGGMKNKAKY
eukprot:scaffold1250_cov190-Alexandrium_tamarense.AAC.7